ncbi:N-acetylgalactosamine kinase isoform X2 [Agrilus planipennis]|nr:N-acetylgalactosamine kinase isoform X2 [Agrilus planipennis]
MALKQDIVLAVSAIQTEKKLFLFNVDAKYPSFECDIENFEINVNGSPTWYQYFLCGVKGILETLPTETPPRGAQIVVDGNVPQSAGLSSSSALVSAAALAIAAVYDLKIPKEKLANLCAASERYIGTQGGGMDQAIAFLASEGCAKYIEFCPLRTTDIMLPREAVFVIAHSLVELNKAATSDFNCRVVECRLAAQLLGKIQGLTWREVRTLGDVQKQLELTLSDMVTLVKNSFHEHPYSKEEIAQTLGVTIDDLVDNSLTLNTSHVNDFKLRHRALHVYEEAIRVQKFCDICNNKDKDSLVKLGQLMSESHESLKNLYECSHPKLNKLVNLVKDVCFGARLTGAGWGGCVVALLTSENVQKFMDLLKNEYYKDLLRNNAKPWDEVIFATSPHSGATIYKD